MREMDVLGRRIATLGLVTFGCARSLAADPAAAGGRTSTEVRAAAPRAGVRWGLAGARLARPSLAAPGPHVYDDVYPGIRLTVEGRPGAMAYRFDLAPGADPRAIRMRYDGAEAIYAEKDGRSLRIHAGGRVLREHGLRCFQPGPPTLREIACTYAVRAGPSGRTKVGFRLGRHDTSSALVIDPVIQWSSYLGGGGGEQGHAIAVDASGSVYVTGTRAGFRQAAASTRARTGGLTPSSPR